MQMKNPQQTKVFAKDDFYERYEQMTCIYKSLFFVCHPLMSPHFPIQWSYRNYGGTPTSMYNINGSWRISSCPEDGIIGCVWNLEKKTKIAIPIGKIMTVHWKIGDIAFQGQISRPLLDIMVPPSALLTAWFWSIFGQLSPLYYPPLYIFFKAKFQGFWCGYGSNPPPRYPLNSWLMDGAFTPNLE